MLIFRLRVPKVNVFLDKNAICGKVFCIKDLFFIMCVHAPKKICHAYQGASPIYFHSVDIPCPYFVFIMQVLNGLLSRDNQKEGISIPIGIIPAGSDNSLVWTVIGVRDPVSAAMAIVKVTLFIELDTSYLELAGYYITNLYVIIFL